MGWLSALNLIVMVAAPAFGCLVGLKMLIWGVSDKTEARCAGFALFVFAAMVLASKLLNLPPVPA